MCSASRESGGGGKGGRELLGPWGVPSPLPELIRLPGVHWIASPQAGIERTLQSQALAH